MTDQSAEFLLRNIASIPHGWTSENESWPHAVRRRKRLARKLLDLAADIEGDPDLGELSFGIHTTSLNGEPEPGMVTLAQLLRAQALHLQPGDKPHIQMGDGSVLTAKEFEKRSRPARKIALRAYTLRRVFVLLQIRTVVIIPRERSSNPVRCADARVKRPNLFRSPRDATGIRSSRAFNVPCAVATDRV
jgi:hypothetical protein